MNISIFVCKYNIKYYFIVLLPKFSQIFYFYTPWKRFLTISGDREMEH